MKKPHLTPKQARKILAFVGQVHSGEHAFALFRLNEEGSLVVDTNKKQPYEIKAEEKAYIE